MTASVIMAEKSEVPLASIHARKARTVRERGKTYARRKMVYLGRVKIDWYGKKDIRARNNTTEGCPIPPSTPFLRRVLPTPCPPYAVSLYKQHCPGPFLRILVIMAKNAAGKDRIVQERGRAYVYGRLVYLERV